jgi:uncharacterized membrane protein
MGLLLLVIGLVVFLGAHVFVTMRGERSRLIARIGEGPYKGLFSLVSIVGIVLIAKGFGLYRANEWIDVWYPPVWTRHLALLLVLPAIILVVAAYVPSHIARAVKHPMLAGVKLWAAAHLIANGDLGSILLFGSILGWAVFDRIAAKRRGDVGKAALQIKGWQNDAVVVIVGAIFYAALALIFHPLVIGVPVMTASIGSAF